MNADLYPIIFEFLGPGHFLFQIVSKKWLFEYEKRHGCCTYFSAVESESRVSHSFENTNNESVRKKLIKHILRNKNADLYKRAKSVYPHDAGLAHLFDAIEGGNIEAARELMKVVDYRNNETKLVNLCVRNDDVATLVFLMRQGVRVKNGLFLTAISCGSVETYRFLSSFCKIYESNAGSALENAIKGHNLEIIREVCERYGSGLTPARRWIIKYHTLHVGKSYEIIDYVHNKICEYTQGEINPEHIMTMTQFRFAEKYFYVQIEDVISRENFNPRTCESSPNFEPIIRWLDIEPELVRISLEKGTVFSPYICEYLAHLEYIELFVSFGYESYIMSGGISRVLKNLTRIKKFIGSKIFELISDYIVLEQDLNSLYSPYLVYLMGIVKFLSPAAASIVYEHILRTSVFSKKKSRFLGEVPPEEISRFLIKNTFRECIVKKLLGSLGLESPRDLFLMIPENHECPAAFARLANKIGFDINTMERMISMGRCSPGVFLFIRSAYFGGSETFARIMSCYIAESDLAGFLEKMRF